jgi:hypothetical protein
MNVPIKTHQTVLDSYTRYIFVTNIDIPSAFFQEAHLLERIFDFVRREYLPNLVVYFEVTGTYTLLHKDTGDTKRWVGSFSPQQAYTLTPHLIFPDSFFPTVRPLLDLRTLTRQLDQLIPDTVWVVDEVKSLILNFSAIVPRTYRVLINKGLLTEYGNRTHRSIQAAFVP